MIKRVMPRTSRSEEMETRLCLVQAGRKDVAARTVHLLRCSITPDGPTHPLIPLLSLISVLACFLLHASSSLPAPLFSY